MGSRVWAGNVLSKSQIISTTVWTHWRDLGLWCYAGVGGGMKGCHQRPLPVTPIKAEHA